MVESVFRKLALKDEASTPQFNNSVFRLELNRFNFESIWFFNLILVKNKLKLLYKSLRKRESFERKDECQPK